MSRKAVQGYSEKTYYDNTRYLGVLATNDPLNEGYFKHLVNFDISDTGQSITPRKGFLTTTLRDNDDYKTPISLSSDTITFKDNNLGHYIAYDFKNKNGYIVDLTHYNIEDRLLPIVNRISNYDWTEVVDYVLTYDTTIKAMYDELVIGTALGQYTTEERYEIILSNIQRSFTDFGEDIRKVNQIIDKDTLTKTLFKVKITGFTYELVYYELPFFLSIYYREDAVTINGVEYPEDTLVFGVVNMNQHPTYNIAERNIASDVSIIPPTMQTLYTASYNSEGAMIETNRPDGHINTLGPMYVKDAKNKYYINYVYPNVSYDIIPYMTLDPASIALNNEKAEWAYRFDIVSTKRFTNPEDVLKEDTVFESNWFKYTGPNDEPTAIFNRRTGYDLNNPDRSLRHYEDNTLIITVIPKSVNGGETTRTVDFIDDGVDQSEDFGPIPNADDLAGMMDLYIDWVAEVTKVRDKRSFREAISTLDATARFHVGSTASTSDTGMNAALSLNVSETHIAKASQDASYSDYFKTGSEILDMLDSGEIPDVNLTFRLYPYVSNLKLTSLYDIVTRVSYQWYFSDLTKFGKKTTRLYPVYNLYKGASTYNFKGNYDILVNTDIIKQTRTMPDLERAGFFEAGYSLRFYMKPYLPDDLEDKTPQELAVIKELWAAGSYITSRQVLYAYDDLTVTTIPEVIVKDPKNIRNAKESIVFQDNRLVLWHNNLVYISEPGEHYYFKEENRKEFPEKVIKVIEYKTVLLVFTVQHLYVIYSEQVEIPLPDEKGDLVMTPSTAFSQQCVLYNILTDEKYADVIQVFNQMVLFYSADGQMFMIKPNVMIDAETQFSLQYFNKSANDVLKNYDVYINERLANYNIDKQVTKDDVQIRSLVSINYIKIFYTVPGFITYILIYDVIANRYTFYDTLTFTDIRDKLFVEGGEAYITVQDNKLFYTMPYLERNIADNYSDMSYINNFKKVAISCLVDSGNLNLNNHINKRYRDLHIVFKNLSASRLLFNAETVIDDIVSHPYYDTRLEVREINGASYFVTVPKSNSNDLIELVDINQVSEVASNAFLYALNHNLFEENNLLMDFEGYTSSKLLTYRTSILGLGKVFRLKLQFISKGSYKIQSFGIVYKERRL